MAFEFRHSSWFAEDVFELLREGQRVEFTTEPFHGNQAAVYVQPGGGIAGTALNCASSIWFSTA